MQFDHGAQYFTVRDELFAASVRRWQAQGVVAPWEGRIGVLEDGRLELKQKTTPRYVGTPAMNAICSHLAADLPIRWQTLVRPPCRTEAGWRLADEQGVDLGEFDYLAVTAPAAQAAALLEDAPQLRESAQRVAMKPCWATMISFDQPLPLAADGIFVNNSPLSWLARNGSKPGRHRDVEAWVLHASPEWSSPRIDWTAERILPAMLDEFWQVTGLQPQEPSFATAHRWRFALPPEPLDQRCLFDGGLAVGACGDWCGGSRVEGAFLSGLALAQHMLKAD